MGIPWRDRNALLLAAGCAPVYRQTDLAAADMMAPVRAALDKIVAGAEPFPAEVTGREINYPRITGGGPVIRWRGGGRGIGQVDRGANRRLQVRVLEADA